MPKADAILLTIDVGQGALTKTTLQFLEAVDFVGKNFFVVFTKSEQKSSDELEELKQYASTKYPLKPEEVIFTSAKNKDVAQLINLLENIRLKGEDILVKNTSNRLKRVCEQAIAVLDAQIASANLETRELDKEIDRVKTQLDKLRDEVKAEIDKAISNINKERDEAVKVFNVEMKGYLNKFVEIAFKDANKLEREFDDAIIKSGRSALKYFSRRVEDIIKQTSLDIEEIAKKVDIGGIPVLSIIDTISLVIAAILIDGVLPGGFVYALLVRLGLELFKDNWKYVEAPIRLLIQGIVESAARGYVKSKINEAIDRATLAFAQKLEPVVEDLKSRLKQEILEKFGESEKSLVEGLEKLKEKKKGSLKEFIKYMDILNEARSDLWSVLEDTQKMN